ncbi:hypothetical protein [Flexivirga alba]|uniref:Secreted protein n=1 Tax=Flexivirga alba TaxID=702742 RepID=A0ABW2AB57_9MICO
MNTRGYVIATTLTTVCALGAIGAAGPSALAAAHDMTGIAHLATATAPTLGSAHSFTHGLGTARPKTVDFGGDPTSYIKNVHWSSWGGKVATGTGTACRPPANGPFAYCRPTTAKIKAFGLGSCTKHGRAAYTSVEWWFPVDGTFNPKNNSVFNTCTADIR